MPLFEPGRLWSRIIETSEAAHAAGALVSIPTAWESLPAGDASMVLRVVHGLERKRLARAESPPRDPFLPFEDELWVGDATETHACVLNKFNVVEHHLLIVTRAFEDQRTLLSLADFAALARCLGEIDGLGFYNAGRHAGASQPHKHLQLVPLPLAPAGPRLPIERDLAQVLEHAPRRSPVAAWPYLHAAAALSWTGDGARDAAEMERTYRGLLAALEGARAIDAAVAAESGEPPPVGPGERQRFQYNLLATRGWMLMIPRARTSVDGIEINALGFAGSFFARSPEQAQRIREIGALALLDAVACRS